MSKSTLLRKYELTVIVDAKLPNEEKESLSKSIVEAIIKSGGKVVNNQVWMERHKMTFKINKCGEGTYFLVNFEGDPAVANSVKSVLRLNEKILRSLIIYVD